MLRRRHDTGKNDDDELRRKLLDTSEGEEDDQSVGNHSVHDAAADPAGPLQELIRVIGQGLTICAAQVCTYLAWLLTGLGRQELTPEQARQLDRLRSQLETRFDHSQPEHQAALAELWELCFPHDGPVQYVSERWKDAGFQGTDPATDFRGGGLYALNNLLYMGRRHPATFQRLLNKASGTRAEVEYPFCVAGINLTYDLQEVVGVRQRGRLLEGPPSTSEGRAFAALLSNNHDAFEELYVSTFEVLDQIWLESGASYLDFPHVMKRTLTRVKDALNVKPRDIVDMKRLLDAVA